nr:MAG TPA: hypothetical protein [Caudoviricetes sp.]
MTAAGFYRSVVDLSFIIHVSPLTEFLQICKGSFE